MIELRAPASPLDWWRMKRLYLRAFPISERKPFAVIRKRHRQGSTDVFLCRKDGRFAGLATTVNGSGLVLLDYFAVDEKLRGQGVGSAFLQQLAARYPNVGLFAEIEMPDGSPEKENRRRFYEHCGLHDLHTSADVFGVPMMMLGTRCTMDFDRYHAFYRENLGEWTASHIRPIPQT